MLLLNDALGLPGRFFSQVYQATTIDDFLSEKNHLPTPSKWNILNPFNYLIGNPLDIVCIDFTNVNVKNHPSGKGWYVFDLTGSLFANPYKYGLGVGSEPLNEFHDGRYAKLGIKYSLSGDVAYLSYFKRFGPPSPQSHSQETQLESRLSPAFPF